VEDVDDAGQLVLGPDRDVDGHAPVRELRAQTFERSEEVGALAVEHVHDDQAREFVVRRAVPDAAGSDLDAHHAAEDDDRSLDDAQGRDRLALEARVAWRVDQVELPVTPGDVRQRRRQRHLAALLVLVPVRHGRPRLDRSEPVHRFGLVQERLDERGLAGSSMTDDGDVADLSGLLSGHARGVLP
jgi:hypothetical protein